MRCKRLPQGEEVIFRVVKGGTRVRACARVCCCAQSCVGQGRTLQRVRRGDRQGAGVHVRQHVDPHLLSGEKEKARAGVRTRGVV